MAQSAQKLTDRNIAQYCGCDCPEPIEPLPNRDSGLPQHAFADVPLYVREPCVVQMGDAAFPIAREGLHRFYQFVPKRDQRQVVYFDSDLDKLLAAITRLHTHGWRHNGRAAEYDEIARRGKLSITCGNISAYCKQVLERFGIRARTVGSMTLDEHNTYNNGHALMEYHCPRQGRWILYDVDLGRRVRSPDGRLLSLHEASNAVYYKERYEFDCLTHCVWIDPYADFDGPPAANSDRRLSSLLFEPVWANEDAARRWYARILQVPSIDGVYLVRSASDRARLAQLGYDNVLDEAEWVGRYYD